MNEVLDIPILSLRQGELEVRDLQKGTMATSSVRTL